MTVILAIETSGEGGGAAVIRDGKAVAEVSVPAARSHGAQLMPCVDKALNEAKATRAQIDIIAVDCGPGSYTGLRIGLAAAAAIGFALDKPVVGVPCFDAMALQHLAGTQVSAGALEFWPVLDARQGEVMTAKFIYASGNLERQSEDTLMSPEDLCDKAAEGAIVFGAGLAQYPGRWDQSKVKVDAAQFTLGAASVGLCAWRQWRDTDPAKIERKRVEPRYFRQVTASTIAERRAAAKA
jgi:tRNA threonylcarbamoyladenosine biosynthesis protein TsaB